MKEVASLRIVVRLKFSKNINSESAKFTLCCFMEFGALYCLSTHTLFYLSAESHTLFCLSAESHTLFRLSAHTLFYLSAQSHSLFFLSTDTLFFLSAHTLFFLSAHTLFCLSAHTLFCRALLLKTSPLLCVWYKLHRGKKLSQYAG